MNCGSLRIHTPRRRCPAFRLSSSILAPPEPQFLRLQPARCFAPLLAWPGTFLLAIPIIRAPRTVPNVGGWVSGSLCRLTDDGIDGLGYTIGRTAWLIFSYFYDRFVFRENRVPHYQRLFQKHDGKRQWYKVSAPVNRIFEYPGKRMVDLTFGLRWPLDLALSLNRVPVPHFRLWAGCW